MSFWIAELEQSAAALLAGLDAELVPPGRLLPQDTSPAPIMAAAAASRMRRMYQFPPLWERGPRPRSSARSPPDTQAFQSAAAGASRPRLGADPSHAGRVL